MFVRKKTKPTGGSAYHQLVESRRVDGRPRQRVVMHLGSHATVDEALEGWPGTVRSMRSEATRNERVAPELSKAVRDAADALDEKLSRLRALRAGGEA